MSDKALRVAAAGALALGLMYWLRKRDSKEKEKEKKPVVMDVVGGHGSKKDKGPPILFQENYILKPFQPAQKGKAKSRGELEADFYRQVTETSHPIKPFIPGYFGLDEIDGSTYLKLENLTHGMELPCVLDLKMGQKTYDETASKEKIEREKKKYPPQETIGFRIVGMKVFRQSTREWWKSERKWCMSITPESMQNAIEQFFYDGRIIKYDLMLQVIDRINEVKTMLEQHPTWRMYGSSLLLVYDAAKSKPQIKVKMIDFAHIFEIKDGGKDDSYLHGLNFLKKCLRQSLAQATARQAQVGGHDGSIVLRDGELVKKEVKADQFDTEVAFYKKAWDSKQPDAISKFMPKLIRVDESVSPRELIISDARLLVRDPNQSELDQQVSSMDIKLGARSFRSDCPNEPKDSYYSKYAAFEQDLSPGRAEEIWSNICGSKEGPSSLRKGKLGKRDYLMFRDATTTSWELGFRLTALGHESYRVSQNDSRSIETRGQFLDCLERFLSGDKGFDLALAESYMAQLQEIANAAAASVLVKECDMVGSSLLFLHCGEKAAIRWIDFANSTAPSSQDNNQILPGIQRLLLAFQELLQKYT